MKKGGGNGGGSGSGGNSNPTSTVTTPLKLLKTGDKSSLAVVGTVTLLILGAALFVVLRRRSA